MERNRCYFCKLPTMMAASSRPVVFSPHFPSSFFLNVSLEVMLQPPARYSAAFAWHPENIISLDFYNSPAIERFFPYSILHTPPGISPSPRCHYFYFMFFRLVVVVYVDVAGDVPSKTILLFVLPNSIFHWLPFVCRAATPHVFQPISRFFLALTHLRRHTKTHLTK